MIPIIDMDDPTYYGDVSLVSRKKSEISFSGNSNDLIPISATSLIVTEIPSASKEIDPSHRQNYNQLKLSTIQPLHKVVLDEEPLADTSYYKSCLGFHTTGLTENSWDNQITVVKDGALLYTTNWYNDLIPNNINSLISSGIASATLQKTKYFDGELNFYAKALRSIKTYLQVEDTSESFVVPVGDLTKIRQVPLSGSVISGEYDFLVLDENLSQIIHKSEVTLGAFTRNVQTNDNHLLVVAVAKDPTKKSFAYKHIDVTGVGVI